ncbi:hydroxymethylglutaryl-CoA lyase [Glaciibacter superstes]|uniref:hydroxymethylglutaryl-CoA lyase n=1 Tax=Glaciibacter superstes TaxID=501023 RepID=UPI0003B5D706|nr:hydroxymethylglutaryl-CoA lyase [Glaciibacter superstes]
MTAIEIVEVGPRDGLQNEAKTLDIDVRAELITRLVDAGVRRMEAVSFVHPKKVPQMKGAEDVLAAVPLDRGVSYIGLVLNQRGVERAALTPVSEVNVVLPVTDGFSSRNQGKTVAEMIEETRDSVALAREARLNISVTLAVAFGCPFEGEVQLPRLHEVVLAVTDMDIDEIAFADTIGVAVPRQVNEVASMVGPLLHGRRLRFHFHNTRNSGYANALSAADIEGAGTIALDSAVGGFGGCPFAPLATGNIGTEDLLYSLRRNSGLSDGLDLKDLCDTADWLSGHLGSPIQSLLPKAGDFPHSS